MRAGPRHTLFVGGTNEPGHLCRREVRVVIDYRVPANFRMPPKPFLNFLAPRPGYRESAAGDFSWQLCTPILMESAVKPPFTQMSPAMIVHPPSADDDYRAAGFPADLVEHGDRIARDMPIVRHCPGSPMAAGQENSVDVEKQDRAIKGLLCRRWKEARPGLATSRGS